MTTEQEYRQWLSLEPPKEELRTSRNGMLYIPSAIIEKNLDEFKSWEISYFKHDFEEIAKHYFITASTTLIVRFDGQEWTRKGTITLPINPNDEIDFSSVLLDLCIADAAKKLGNRFGRNLNGRGDYSRLISQQDPYIKKPKPSIIIQQKLKQATTSGDVSTVKYLLEEYDFTGIDTDSIRMI